MTVLCIPRDERPWPTLGPQVCDWLEACAVFGPGDLRGDPLILDDERRALIYRFYEVFPRDHERAGRRRFKRCAVCVRKGVGKTELAALVALAELHPEGPVRCDGWDAAGKPVGVGVRDPYIPMIAYTEEQSDELAFRALYVIAAESAVADDFRIGLDRIDRKNGDGRAVALAGAPDARDGSRVSFQVFDEVGRMNLPRLVEAHQVMTAGAVKRKAADAWGLEIGTAHVPGEGSVGEATAGYARAVADGTVDDPRLFYFARSAGMDHDLGSPDGVRAAVLEASGPAAVWSDVEGIVEQWQDPTKDRPMLARLWLNQPRQSSAQAFDVARWNELATPGHQVPDGAKVVLGFDGAFIHDATALVGVEIETGHVFVVGVWARPNRTRADWTVDRDAVDAAVTEAFRRWDVWLMYADPHYWEDHIASWKDRFRRGNKVRVDEFDTRGMRNMSFALRNFATAIETGDLSHDGSDVLRSHVGNAQRQDTRLSVGTDGQPLWSIRKERPDSPQKIDLAVAAVLAWEARNAAIASGAGRRSAYAGRVCRCPHGPQPSHLRDTRKGCPAATAA